MSNPSATLPRPPAVVAMLAAVEHLLPVPVRAWICPWCTGLCDLDAPDGPRWCPCIAWHLRNS